MMLCKALVCRTQDFRMLTRPSGISFPRPLQVASSGIASQHAMHMGPPMQPQRMPAVIWFLGGRQGACLVLGLCRASEVTWDAL